MDKKSKYFAGLGRRKRATAKVILIPSKAQEVIINDKIIENPSPIYLAPLELVDSKNFQIKAKVSGGGFASQQIAIRLAISRALILIDNTYKQILRKNGFLTRDPREKERKKPGLKRARRAPQWQKR